MAKPLTRKTVLVPHSLATVHRETAQMSDNNDIKYPVIQFTSEEDIFKWLGKQFPKLIPYVDYLATRRSTYRWQKRDAELEAKEEQLENARQKINERLPALHREIRELKQMLHQITRDKTSAEKKCKRLEKTIQGFKQPHPDLAEALDENRILCAERDGFKRTLKSLYAEITKLQLRSPGRGRVRRKSR